MSHIRGVSAARKPLPDHSACLHVQYAVIGPGTSKDVLRADLFAAAAEFMWRKKYEPLPGT